jgi:diacylglycerol kinase family enzyme
MVVGIGFEQQMIAQADRSKKDESGQFAYLGALYDAIEVNQANRLRICLDEGECMEIETGSLVIANAAPSTTVLAQGGGKPNVTDGLLDVTWLAKTSSAGENLLNLAELAMRSLLEPEQLEPSEQQTIQHRRVKSIKVAGQDKLNYVVDGENRDAEEITINVNPLSLYVYSTELL